jgi:hypothetical protein
LEGSINPGAVHAVRRWAAEQGIEVAKRGRLAKNVVDAFLKAN